MRYVSSILFIVTLLLWTPVWAQIDPERGDVRLVILSDFNGAYGSLVYSSQVAQVLDVTRTVWQPDLFLSAGDIIGGQDTSLPAERFAAMWQTFDVEVAARLRKANIPYAFAIGNHDGSSLRTQNKFIFQRERDAARAYWRQPLYEANLPYQSREDFPFNYSFVLNEVFFAVWDASSATITDEQKAWLARELARPAAQGAELRILLGHLPLYGVSEEKNRPGEVLEGGDALRRWLEEQRLDLYISGHHAAYYPAKVGEVTLLHSGGIGARPLLGSAAEPRSAVTVLDIDFDAEPRLRLTTFDTRTLNIETLSRGAGRLNVISPQSLPETLEGLNGTLTRLDLSP